ncbi:MAG: nucleotidyltransferase family protein [Planctomycetes bacterium]|nr:nucleotidyltransferase family protein [Planctomycetota bacterium]
MDPVLELCSLRPGQSLRDVLTALEVSGMEIVLVTSDSDRLLGILTDGDVRRALLAGATLNDSLERYLQKNYFFVTGEAGRAEILDLMQAKKISQVPILNDKKKLVGLHTLYGILGAKEKPNWAVVMAGGRGERLKPITDSLPKPMIKVAGRPVLERLVLHLMSHGIRNIFLSINYMGDLIEAHFGDGSSFGCKIRYLKETIPLGTGGALSLLTERPENSLLVFNGDLLTQVNITRMLDFHKEGGFLATVGYREYIFTVPYGVLEIDGTRLQGIREKPLTVWNANTGIYVLDPSLLERVPSGKSFSLPSLLEECLSRGEAVGSFSVEEDWLDVGRPDELKKALGEI